MWDDVSMFKYILSGALVLSLSDGALPAFGSDDVVEEVISTATRSATDPADYAGAVAVVSGKDLAFGNATHFSETAVRLAGVNFARNNGQEYLASIRSPILTGAGACGAFLMAQDGIALRSSGFCNVNELFEAFTEQAARIEVTKGPGSALYGSNALHGIINVISPAADRKEDRLSLEGGAHDFLRMSLSVGTVGARHGIRAQAIVTHDGGFREQSGYDQQKISLRHDYKGEVWEVASQLMATNLDQQTAGYITGFEAYKDRDVAQRNPNPEAYRRAKSLRYWSRFSTEIASGIRWQATPYVRILDMAFLMHFLPGQPVEENRQTGVGLQNGFYFNEGGDLEIITGADVEYTRGSLRQFQEKETTGSAFLQATIPAGRQYDYTVDSLMAAAFLQARWQLTPKLQMQGGVRLEHMRYDYTNKMLAGRTDEAGNVCGFGGCRYSRPESRRDDFTGVSPKLGLIYTFSADHSGYLTLGQGFRAPQATELYRLQRAQQVADLGNVSLTNIEVGLRGRAGRLRYDISAYAMKKSNYIFRDVDYFNVDSGRSDHIGSDILLDWQVSDQLSLRTNISLARHRYAFDYMTGGVNLRGRDVDSAPRHYGGVQVKWTPVDFLTAELEWVHMGSYYLDPENAHNYAGHDYVNLRAEATVTDNYRVFFRIMNLTNVTYAERADFTSFTAERYFPGKPRSLYVGLKAVF